MLRHISIHNLYLVSLFSIRSLSSNPVVTNFIFTVPWEVDPDKVKRPTLHREEVGLKEKPSVDSGEEEYLSWVDFLWM